MDDSLDSIDYGETSPEGHSFAIRDDPPGTPPTHHETTTWRDMPVDESEVHRYIEQHDTGQRYDLTCRYDEWERLYHEEKMTAGLEYRSGIGGGPPAPSRQRKAMERSVYWRRRYAEAFDLRECRRCNNAAKFIHLNEETSSGRVVSHICDVCARFEYYAALEPPPPHPQAALFVTVPSQVGGLGRFKLTRCLAQVRPPMRPCQAEHRQGSPLRPFTASASMLPPPLPPPPPQLRPSPE